MIRERENYNAFLLHFLERLNSCDSIEKKITESLTDICEYYGFKRGFIYQTDGFRYFYLKETVGNNDNVLRQRFEISEMPINMLSVQMERTNLFMLAETKILLGMM